MTARLALLSLLLSLAACATTPDPGQTAPPLTWPSPPAEARVSHVRSFSQPEDLGIGKGFLQRLSDLLFGATHSGMVRPMAVVETGKVVFVADPGLKGVHRFNTGSGRYDLVRAEDEQPILSPVGLAADGEGNVYVSDSAQGIVFRIRPDAKFAERMTLSEAPRQPTGLAVDPLGKRLYVVDTGQHQIKVYGLDGALQANIGRRGNGELEFNFPTMLWRAADGKLLLTDSLNFRSQILAADGHFLGMFGRPGDAAGDAPRQKGIATDRHGHVYVVDSLLHAIQIFDQSGQFLLSIGERGQAPGEFWLPTGIYISEDDLIYVADSYNKRVQVFRYVGGAS